MAGAYGGCSLLYGATSHCRTVYCLQDDGVDGRKIYIYGEAWDFGEVAGNQRGRNAAQMNLAGGWGMGVGVGGGLVW